MPSSKELYQASYEQIPRVWYERSWGLAPSVLIFILASVVLDQAPEQAYLLFQVLSAGIYVGGCLADKASTDRVVATAQRLQTEAGIDVDELLFESNKILGSSITDPAPTWRANVYDAMLFVPAVAWPQVGLAAGVMRWLHGGLSNAKKLERLEYVEDQWLRE